MNRTFLVKLMLLLCFFFADAKAHDNVVVIPLSGATGDAQRSDVLTGKTFSNAVSKGLTGNRPASPPQTTGQTTSYQAGDNGTYQPGETVSTRWSTYSLVGYGNTDYLTGLIWTPAGEFMDVETWSQAVSYCENLVTGSMLSGYRDWRLPTIRELLSLVDYSRSNPALPSGSPNILPSASSYCWSATTSGSNSNEALYITFGHGLTGIAPKTDAYFAICVRGGNHQ